MILVRLTLVLQFQIAQRACRHDWYGWGIEAMGEGAVDLNWAKEHHSLGLEEQGARVGFNESQQQPAATPAE